MFYAEISNFPFGTSRQVGGVIRPASELMAFEDKADRDAYVRNGGHRFARPLNRAEARMIFGDRAVQTACEYA